mgnify:FL=1
MGDNDLIVSSASSWFGPLSDLPGISPADNDKGSSNDSSKD